MLKRCLFLIGLLIFWRCGVVYTAEIGFEVNTGVGYDSNIFRSTNAPEQDVYFSLAPKADLILPFNKVYFSLSSRAKLQQYMNRTDANFQELIFSGLGRFNVSDYVSFGLQDELVVSSLLGSAEKLTDVPRQRDFVNNRFSSNLRHELKEDILAASLEYVNIIRNYERAEEDNWTSHSGRFQIEYFLGYKTSTQLSLGLTRKVYEADLGYISVPVAVSLKRILGSKFGASFTLGLENRRYDEFYKDRNWNEPNLSLGITGSFTPKTTSSLLLQRKVYDSDILFGYAFVSNAGITTLVLSLSDAAQLVLEGLYSRNDYILFKWTSDVFKARLAIQYRLFRWGTIVLGYGYEKWTSNLLGFLDYNYHRHVMDFSYKIVF